MLLSSGSSDLLLVLGVFFAPGALILGIGIAVKRDREFTSGTLFSSSLTYGLVFVSLVMWFVISEARATAPERKAAATRKKAVEEAKARFKNPSELSKLHAPVTEAEHEALFERVKEEDLNSLMGRPSTTCWWT